ncbi:hypothetical protein [Sporomusa acidovorans]|uniref:Uncharacterized protein n=1 Tax=Sporomusa acidovorans (strain ATCC 49682 / DSM 3132 / Mol) TaxID=1123286 RepID=A0ABZ3J6B3_SPOA4|nr:hypothetical protein [Sporomusa acidovorans]OZC18491.1 hypothetical protein SPACI_33570 [Sporomusa acidovorans DSM 3132]SDE36421.1 hypothetical protein SAMN04488499_101227 [Sporomusa acidovorans]
MTVISIPYGEGKLRPIYRKNDWGCFGKRAHQYKPENGEKEHGYLYARAGHLNYWKRICNFSLNKDDKDGIKS